MNSKHTTESIGLGRNTTTSHVVSHSHSHSTCDQRFIPQSWNAFQSMRQGGAASLRITPLEKTIESSTVVITRQPQNLRTTLRVNGMSRRNGNYKNLTSSREQCKEPPQNASQLLPVKHSLKNSRWARSWANQRAQQTILTKNSNERVTGRGPRDDDTNFVKCERVLPRSRGVELDEKAAEIFGRLRSIYMNKEERGRRVQSIRERMDEFQKQSVRKEVNKSIQEFHMKMKEDETNRKELKRLREKFSETKKCRRRTMHMSLNALKVPAVPRFAYGLPQEGKEFSVPFSSKKTTDEIKKMWRMAIVRKNCIDSFLDKVSQGHQDLPDITVVKRIRKASSIKSQASSTAVQEELPAQRHRVIEKSRELISKNELNNPNHQYDERISSLTKIQPGLLESLESLSCSDDEVHER